jgi:transcriptional regulator with XRE-family HTH domain
VKAKTPNLRFREAREALGLSPEEVASRSGVQGADIWEIEGLENDLTDFYSVRDVEQFCRVLGIHPIELFGDDISEPGVSAEELVRRIHEECRARSVTLEQLDDGVGGSLAQCVEPAEKLLSHMTAGGLQWLCRELRIDWRRVLLSL